MRSRRKQRGAGWWFGNNNDNDNGNGNDTDTPRCQCPKGEKETPCGKAALKESLFCEEHQRCKKPPLSDEGPYDPEPYAPRSVRLSHNCLMYALGLVNLKAVKTCDKSRKNCRDNFRQPGNVTRARNGLSKNTRLTCDKVEEMFMQDYPFVKRSSFYDKCPPGYRKIAGIVDERNDHHWLKLHSDGMWSHKSGELEVGRVDARKQRIFFPKPGAADFDYTKRKNSDLNYEDFCGFYCVPVAPGGQDVWVERERREERREERRSRKQQRKQSRRREPQSRRQAPN